MGQEPTLFPAPADGALFDTRPLEVAPPAPATDGAPAAGPCHVCAGAHATADCRHGQALELEPPT